LGGPGIDAEDIAQEVFCVAHRRLHTLRAEVKPSTWLFGITSRVVLGQRRRQRLRRWLGDDAARAAPTVSSVSTPLETVEQRRALARAYGILERMPEALRVAFILFEIDGLTTEAIAEVTGTKPATTRVRLHRARALFYERLDKLQEQEPSP
jgi:RNA polymerase sigma-70 factor (ECF subfamily)